MALIIIKRKLVLGSLNGLPFQTTTGAKEIVANTKRQNIIKEASP